jgi:hypothetical protein
MSKRYLGTFTFEDEALNVNFESSATDTPSLLLAAGKALEEQSPDQKFVIRAIIESADFTYEEQ